MRKPLLALTFVLLLVTTHLIAGAPLPRSMRTHLNTDFLRAMSAYRRLETRLPREELRAITAIGILNGAKEAEAEMERHLVEVVKDLLYNTDVGDDDGLIEKVERIEKQLVRDRRALMILTSAMDLVTGAKDSRDFKAEMRQALQQVRRQSNDELIEVKAEAAEETEEGTNVSIVLLTGRQEEKAEEEQQPAGEQETKDASARVGALRQRIISQVREMKTLVEQKIENTLDYLIKAADEDSLLAQASKKVLRKRDASLANEEEVPAEVRMLKSILSEDDIRQNLVDDNEMSANRKDVQRLDSVEKNDDDDDDYDDFTLKPETKNVIANRSRESSTTTTTSPEPSTKKVTRATSAATSATRKPTTTKSTTKAGNIRLTPAAITATLAPTVAVAPAKPEGPQFAKQEEGSPEADYPIAVDVGEDAPPPPGGGLVGIITSLSGGEGGSDIGALLGALTGVVSQIFGPNGLDIESLIGSATSLISGLLSGNKNFGTVLGGYVGIAFDGLSGGGGAVNNGQFIGNFLGTVIASLSADPEEEEGGIRPFLFAQNLVNSFLEAKNRKPSDGDGDNERREDRHGHGHEKNKRKGGGYDKGSDSGDFIKHIVSHLVGNLVSVLLNASLGASGGASHASASLLTSSSHKAAAGGGGHADSGGHGGGGGKW